MVVDAQGSPVKATRLLSAIDRLYSRFDSMYMHKWRSYFTTVDAIEDWKKTWSESLERHGITLQLAFAGVQRCELEHAQWSPSLPEFIALCKPQIDHEQAFYDTLRALKKRHEGECDEWPLPAALYWAAQDYGYFELRDAGYGAAGARWKKLLDRRLAEQCPDVPRFRLALAAPPRNSDGVAITSAEAKAAAMAAMANMANRKPSRELAIRNAKDLLAKAASGQPVTFAQMAFAKEALDRLCPDGDDSEQAAPAAAPTNTTTTTQE